MEPVEAGLVEIERPCRSEGLPEGFLGARDPVDVADPIEGLLVRVPEGEEAGKAVQIVPDGLVEVDQLALGVVDKRLCRSKLE